MPKIEQVQEFIEQIAPHELCEAWDNSGLLVNACDSADKILVTLDITGFAVQEAIVHGCKLIVSHHPVIFNPIKRISAGDIVYKLAVNGISALCAHTNLDAANGGVNDILAERLGLVKVNKMPPIGRIGSLPRAMSPKAFANLCAVKLGAAVQLASASKHIKTVAVIGGCGDDYLAEAIAAKADCLVTGEGGHHVAIDAVSQGISLVVAGHYETEWPVVLSLAKRLRQEFPDTEILVSNQKSPYLFVD